MDAPIVSTLLTDVAADPVEVVERKGLGHPDTICDAIAEAVGRSLCRAYLDRCGVILHHNVDKALLCGGRAAPAFGGGTVLDPIAIYLGGRAVSQIGNDPVPIRDIAIETARAWLRETLHALDPDRHVSICERIQPGSADLQSLFARGHGRVLANDTSIGIGYAPLTRLERLVLAIETRINGRDCRSERPAWGEDVKVMAVRRGEAVAVTLACAMIGRYLSDREAYLAEKAALSDLVRRAAADYGFEPCMVGVNTADEIETGSIYLTVTGTSAEAGDDGEVGRGNRVNGLITPLQPMSLEAAAGKNPVSHAGKLYNVVARQIAEDLVAAAPQILRAQCLLVSRIGAAITDPALIDIRIAAADKVPATEFQALAADIAADRIARIPHLIEDFVAGAIALF